MDGYAVNTKLTPVDAPVAVSQIVTAGDMPEALAPGTAARIFTGGIIPAGADAVIMQEDAKPDGDSVALPQVKVGTNIRRRGQDIVQGTELLAKGQRLTPLAIGLLASVGIAEVPVMRTPSVAIIATGSELLKPGAKPEPNKIFNSNQYMLSSWLESLGCSVTRIGPVADNLDATEKALLKGSECDLIISTGGVSVGDADWIKTALNKVGRLQSWKIAIKPGKPVAYGSVSGKPFFGLPGNPVSAYVTFALVVLPFLRKLLGQNPDLPMRKIPLGFSVDKRSDRTHYMRVQIDSSGCLQPFNNQSSGVLTSLNWAHALAEIPANQTCAVGDKVNTIIINDSLYGS
jgi:molybdopterin molybdotransferase